jgi:hypothetical protein
LCAIAAGAVLLGLSYGWTTLFPPAGNWGEDQAAELVAIDAQIVCLDKKLAEAQLRGVEIPKDPPPLVRLLEKEAALRMEMQHALGASERTAKKLRLAGIAMLCIGIAIFFYDKSCKCGDG